uniref:Uncharacterized protein n=1 Tax=viral metagenome TaxID=1070528 RepID=A0A6C0CGR0_9ZZZZ
MGRSNLSKRRSRLSKRRSNLSKRMNKRKSRVSKRRNKRRSRLSKRRSKYNNILIYGGSASTGKPHYFKINQKINVKSSLLQPPDTELPDTELPGIIVSYLRPNGENQYRPVDRPHRYPYTCYLVFASKNPDNLPEDIDKNNRQNNSGYKHVVIPVIDSDSKLSIRT